VRGVSCLHRNGLCHYGHERLTAEPCDSLRHAIATVECAELRALAETRPRRRVIGTSDDYTLMVSPGTALGRHGEQSHSHATAESVPVPWSCFVESGKKQLLGE
jgi:hypothetical protein